jgi:membrane protein DedA with SNARE-associated domain
LSSLLLRHNRLDVASIVGAAWLGATLGGVGGWLIGLRAGHAAFAAPGPLHRARLAALVQGERFFERFGPIAVFLTPSWVAGINAMRASRFLPFNAIAALAWALATGVGGYLVGPPVIDLLSDIGLYGSLALVLLLVVSVLGARTGRRRRRQRRART